MNTGEEPQKAGVAPRDADAFIAVSRKDYELTIEGLMCIPPEAEPPAPHFALLAKIAARNGLERLSMGMSADFEIAPDDGWCDAPDDAAYNRPVKLPYPASAERMWRDDGLYDLVVVLGYNDDPPEAGRGSAIFLHLARPDYAPTQGCVALARPDLEAVLALAGPGSALEVLRPG